MSNETKWTPGPWKFGKELTAHSGEWLISMDAGDKGRGIAIAETRPGSGSEIANARIIAAAPELYDALQDLLYYGKDGSPRHYAMAVNNAEKALAKARGESHD